MDWLSRLREPLLTRGGHARNRPFLDAAMASAALVAGADGPVSFAERYALDEVLDGIEALRAFDAHRAVDLFDGLIAELRERPEQGRANALRAVAVFAGEGEWAALLLRIGCAVARADGAVPAPAKAEIERIAAALGLPAPELGDEVLRASDARARGTSVIVLGNGKGGTGKSTTAMHLIVALLRRGHRVGSIDLDGRQGTLSRYIANRDAFARRSGRQVALPLHRCLEEAEARDREEARAIEGTRLKEVLADLAACRFVVVDTPGSHSHLARLGHGLADVLITPLNDSFLDIDALAHIDRERREVLSPSAYSKMVWEQNDRRAAGGRPAIDWIVMRNRLAHIDARNTREMADLLDRLAARMGFRLQPGLSERVVFRELFYRGLTLLDLPGEAAVDQPSASRRHARREVEDLLAALRISDPAAKLTA